MKQLDLYVIPGCPYCRKVLDFLHANDISYNEIDIYADDAAKAHLKEVGGKVQCPCLFVDGQPMYESQDIIDYLKDQMK